MYCAFYSICNILSFVSKKINEVISELLPKAELMQHSLTEENYAFYHILYFIITYDFSYIVSALKC